MLSCGEPTVRDVCEDACTALNDCGVEVGCDNPGWRKSCVDLTNQKGCRPVLEAYVECVDHADECSECNNQDLAWIECWN
jgi:hypothetical protein